MTAVATYASALTGDCTVADLLQHLGGVPPQRVLMVPTPGTATEKNIFEVEARTGRLWELIDGVLVEKAMGKLGEFFAASVRLAWSIDPRSRTAISYTSPDQGEAVREDGRLRGQYPAGIRASAGRFVGRSRACSAERIATYCR